MNQLHFSYAANAFFFLQESKNSLLYGLRNATSPIAVFIVNRLLQALSARDELGMWEVGKRKHEARINTLYHFNLVIISEHEK
jgi:hypothetical protein